MLRTKNQPLVSALSLAQHVLVDQDGLGEALAAVDDAVADGTEIDDGKLYTVAAWAGTVDESYVSSTVKAHSELGTITDLMTAYLADAGEVSPAKDGRITLNWEQDAA